MSSVEELPRYNHNDVVGWFTALDDIFERENEDTLTRFSRSLALLSDEASIMVKDIIKHFHSIPDPYLAMKERLCVKIEYGKRERLAWALGNVRAVGQKPSVYVDRLDFLLRDISMEDVKRHLLLRALPMSVNISVKPGEHSRHVAHRLDEFFTKHGYQW